MASIALKSSKGVFQEVLKMAFICPLLWSGLYSSSQVRPNSADLAGDNFFFLESIWIMFNFLLAFFMFSNEIYIAIDPYITFLICLLAI